MIEHFYRNAFWIVFYSLSLSTATVCTVHTDKDKVMPFCSDSSLNLEGHLRNWEVSLIPATSHRRHCRSSKDGLQFPGSEHTHTHTKVNNVYESCIIHSSSSGSWIQSPYTHWHSSSHFGAIWSHDFLGGGKKIGKSRLIQRENVKPCNKLTALEL